jgi:hypothetical protein
MRVPPGIEVRKVAVYVEETYSDMGKDLPKPVKRAAAAAVVKNPYAGGYHEDLSLLIDLGEFLGGFLARKAREAAGISREDVENYGKAAVVGLDGELSTATQYCIPSLGRDSGRNAVARMFARP